MVEGSPIEVVQLLARQRKRGEQSPLLVARTLPASEGERISHLPISQRLAQAWVSMTGEPFRLHQSLALSSLRRGEPFALMGGGATARQTVYLLLHELLHGESDSRALLLLPDEATVDLYLSELARLNDTLGASLSLARVAPGPPGRAATTARVVLATPHTLHARLLRHHDRAWKAFWSNLRFMLFADVDYYSGVAIGHLAALLMRSARLTSPDEPLLLAATLSEVYNADTVLSGINGQPWRIITVLDVPYPATTLALWQAEGELLREVVSLALACRREGYTVHITGEPLEVPLLLQLLGGATEGISVGAAPAPAQVQVVAGYNGARPALHRALASRSQLVLLLLGLSPAERTLARLVRDAEHAAALLDEAFPTWVLPASNAYVSVQHLLCAASERPLTFDEIDAWQSGEIVDHLERQNQLARLPDDEALWQPQPSVGDPYAGFDVRAAGIPAAYLADEYGTLYDAFDPSAFDRWGFIGATLPPARGSLRVTDRNDETGVLMLRPEQPARLTFPLRRCNVTVRDERDRRALRGRMVGWGRVVIEEEIYGYREARASAATVEHVLTEPLSTRWAAPAVWIDLPVNLQIDGQLVGWSLSAALALKVVCSYIDTVPAYDAGQRRIYLVDAQPGGNGLATWVYEQLETLLPLAYDVALDCRNDALLEPVARVDMDWLLTLLGGEVAIPAAVPTVATAAHTSAPEAREASAAAASAGYQAWPEPAAAPHDDRPAHVGDQQSLPLPAPAVPERNHSEPKQQRPTERRAGRSGTARRKREEGRAGRREGVRSQRNAEPAAEALPPPPDPHLTPADAQAMIERMRRLREEREAAVRAAQPVPSSARRSEERFPTAPRFHEGDRVFCLPYGYGEVRASRIENGHEILSVAFPDFGELTIEPSVSVVRRIEGAVSDDAEDGL